MYVTSAMVGMYRSGLLRSEEGGRKMYWYDAPPPAALEVGPPLPPAVPGGTAVAVVEGRWERVQGL